MRWILLPFYKWRRAKLVQRLSQSEAKLRKINRTGAIKALGYVTLNWAMIEVALDWCNVIIAPKLPKREPFPINLTRKLVMFRRGHNQLPELASLQKDGAALADLIALAATLRHDLVHGMGLMTLGEDIVQFVRHRVPREPEHAHTLIREIKPYTQDAIWDASEAALDLAEKTVDHMKRLLPLLLEEDEMNDFLREIGI
jgi:hypothetical protein